MKQAEESVIMQIMLAKLTCVTSAICTMDTCLRDEVRQLLMLTADTVLVHMSVTEATVSTDDFYHRMRLSAENNLIVCAQRPIIFLHRIYPLATR